MGRKFKMKLKKPKNKRILKMENLVKKNKWKHLKI